MHYVVAVFKDPDSCYGVCVPDLPGIVSAGDTMAEALFIAREGIELQVCGMQEEQIPFPPILPLAKHKKDPDYEGAIWGVVPYKDPKSDYDLLEPLVWDAAKTPYLVLLHPTPTGYDVAVPDLPECRAAAFADPEDAIEAGRCAIEAHIARLAADGRDVPPQRPFAEHQSNPAYADGLWAVIPVSVPSAAPAAGG